MAKQPGDPCPHQDCAGRLRVRTSRRVGDVYERRLECRKCETFGGIQIIDADRVLARAST